MSWDPKEASFTLIKHLMTEKSETRSGRPRKRTVEVIQALKESIEQSPKRSLRKRCQSLDLSYSSTQMICRGDLNKYPYRIQMVQELTAADKEKIMIMAVSFSEA